MPDDMENSDSNQSRPDVTNLLMRLADGDAEAATDLLPQIYAELRATAGAYFRAQRSDHTLQPTALVHEAYIRLINLPETKWQNRAHFCAVAATAMRHILINHARKKAATNRAHDNRAAYKTMIATASMDMALDLLALDELLETLKSANERQARILELRFFGGLTVNEVAAVMSLSSSTVEREWRFVRAWLLGQLRGANSDE